MKKLLTGLLLASSILAPNQVQAQNKWQSPPEELTCNQANMLERDDEMWNSRHVFGVYAERWGENKVYVWETGDVAIVTRSDEFLGGEDYNRKERYVYLGNINTGYSCPALVSIKDRMVEDTDWITGKKYNRWFYVQKTDNNARLGWDYIPGTSCRYIYRQSSLKPDTLSNRKVFTYEDKQECLQYSYPLGMPDSFKD